MAQQTAVEWLALRYHHRQGYLSQDDIAEAKEMEKQQIKFAYNDGACEILEDKYRPMEDYFKQTYNK
jgi:hypothetical protein